MQISIHQEIRNVFPAVVVGYLHGTISNGEAQPELWKRIEQRRKEIAAGMDAESIRMVEGIRLGKLAYRELGKDPNRYRLSAEALMRRIVKGQELYRINTAVDVLNLVSLTTGITIGGFDRSLVEGDVELGIGLQGEEFEAIGRGPLNVEYLPVYRDSRGVIGNPTSDCMRTRIRLESNSILMLITGFYGKDQVSPVLLHLEELLAKFCSLGRPELGIIN